MRGVPSCAYCGCKAQDCLAQCPSRTARRFVKGLGTKPKIPWKQVFRGKEYEEEELDLIEKMLTWNPDKRITVEQALEHPFMEKLHDPTDEPVTFPLDDFEFDREDVKLRELKNRLWEEVLRYHPEFGSPMKKKQ